MSTRPGFALIDCNNFFVSCERLFRPDLEGRPVVVLSSNDGCAISRSSEAKALGIPMGAPAFKYRQLFKEQGVVQFSANFELYGDVSERIIRLLTSLTPRTEVYSVDEAFLDLSELNIKDYDQWGRQLKAEVLRQVGVPVSVGLAATKTLAKLASDRSKKDAELEGVLNLITLTQAEREEYLQKTPVSDIWGIGRRLAPKVRAEGAYTALDMSRMRPALAGSLMGINGRQLVSELNGFCCYQIEPMGKIRKSVMHGRMFGEDTNDFSVLEAAAASLTARAAYDLRREGLLAQKGFVSLYTNRHKPGYARTDRLLEFDTPSADTGILTARVVSAMALLFRQGIPYHRANIGFYGLVSEQAIQADLFGNVDLPSSDASKARMAALDALNARYGKRTVRYAAEDLSLRWEPKRNYRSPRYTSNWDELPLIGKPHGT